MSGQVGLKDIWKMLDDCADGYKAKPKEHHWWVFYSGKTYNALPLGEHGKRANPEIQIGRVRKMVRHFLIDNDCAKGHFESL